MDTTHVLLLAAAMAVVVVFQTLHLINFVQGRRDGGHGTDGDLSHRTYNTASHGSQIPPNPRIPVTYRER
jgi:hypothetical protein